MLMRRRLWNILACASLLIFTGTGLLWLKHALRDQIIYLENKRFFLGELLVLDLAPGWSGPKAIVGPYGGVRSFPSFTLSAGYATLGNITASSTPAGFAADDVDIGGFNTRLGAALDWYLNPLLSLGVRGNVELLVLSRSGGAQPELAAAAPQLGELYSRDGSGVGLGASMTAVLGLHF